ARHEERSDDGDVDQDRGGQPQPELLQAHDRPCDEAHHGGEHDEPGGGDEPPRPREPDHDRLLVRRPGVPGLPHAAHEEDLVSMESPKSIANMKTGIQPSTWSYVIRPTLAPAPHLNTMTSTP